MGARRRTLASGVLAAFLIAGAAAAPHTTARGPAPLTLVVLGTPLVAFAQDGDMIAWVTCTDAEGNAVFVRRAGGGARSSLGAYPSPELPGCDAQAPHGLALAGDRALAWAEAGAMNIWRPIYALTRRSQPRLLERPVESPDGGRAIVAVRGDGPDLVYAILGREATDESLARWRVTDGHVTRADGSVASGRSRRSGSSTLPRAASQSPRRARPRPR